LRRALLLLCLATCGSAASAEDQHNVHSPTPPPPLKPAETTERLLVGPPRNWELVYQFNNRKTRLSEFVPPGQTAGAWDAKLVLESHADLEDTDPIQMLMAEVKRLQETCTFVHHFNLFSGFENGYPTSVRLVLCGENRATGQGEIAVAKAIQGEDYLYLLNLKRRLPPFEEAGSAGVAEQEVGVWANYLSRIQLCDTASASHPCPAEN